MFNFFGYNYCMIIVVMLLTLMAPLAHAYIGPGMGLGVIFSTLGILFGIGLLIFALIWFPIKRKIKSLRAAKDLVKKL